MLEFVGAAENLFFSAAIVLMVLIGAVQLVGLGGHFDAHFDTHVDADGDLLGWLGFGRLPLLMLLVVFLAVFGLTGLIGQQAILDATGALLSPWIAVPAAAIVALPLTGLSARGLAKVLPGDFTTAVPLEVLIGRTAHVTIGRASHGSPARAKVEDQYGQTHYVMVEPEGADQSFEAGEPVLLVRQDGSIFRAISRGDFRLPRLDG